MRAAIQIAHEAGRKVAFTLSDTFCIARHGDDFRKLIAEGTIDIAAKDPATLTPADPNPLDAVWTDPPYGVDYEGKAGSFEVLHACAELGASGGLGGLDRRVHVGGRHGRTARGPCPAVRYPSAPMALTLRRPAARAASWAG